MKNKVKATPQPPLDATRAPVFIDAFSGCGGLSLGLMQAGWKGLFAIEKDSLAFDTLQHNLCSTHSKFSYDWPAWLELKPWSIDDLLDQHRSVLQELRGTVDLLAGGPPCQGFSSAGRRQSNDPRNLLVKRYLQMVELIEPAIVLLENVKGFTSKFKSDGGAQSHNFSEEVIEALTARYHVETTIVRACDFGVPQKRPRFLLIGLLKQDGLQWPAFNPFKALWQDRKEFLAVKGLSPNPGSRSALSDLEFRRNGIKPSPDSKGFMATDYRHPRTAYQRAMRIDAWGSPSDTRLARHQKHIVARFEKVITICKRDKRLNTSLSREVKKKLGIKKAAFRVLDPLKPAPTITSMPDDLLHYDEPRTLTVRENARLQTFPDWFEFKGNYTTGGDRRRREVPRFTQVANAVPPLLAEQLGLLLRSRLQFAWEQKQFKEQAGTTKKVFNLNPSSTPHPSDTQSHASQRSSSPSSDP